VNDLFNKVFVLAMFHDARNNEIERNTITNTCSTGYTKEDNHVST